MEPLPDDILKFSVSQYLHIPDRVQLSQTCSRLQHVVVYPFPDLWAHGQVQLNWHYWCPRGVLHKYYIQAREDAEGMANWQRRVLEAMQHRPLPPRPGFLRLEGKTQLYGDARIADWMYRLLPPHLRLS